MTDQREVRRWDLVSGDRHGWITDRIGECLAGNYVLASDFDALEAENAELRGDMDRFAYEQSREMIDALKAERDGLGARLEAATSEIEHQRDYIRERNFPEPYRIGTVIAVGKELRYVMQIVRVLHDYPDMAIEVAAYWESALTERDAALAEVDRLERIEIKYKNLCEVLNEQTALIERLRAALAIHGRHHHGCSWNGHWTTCDCGLIAALRTDAAKP